MFVFGKGLSSNAASQADLIMPRLEGSDEMVSIRSDSSLSMNQSYVVSRLMFTLRIGINGDVPNSHCDVRLGDVVVRQSVNKNSMPTSWVPSPLRRSCSHQGRR